MAEGWKYLLAQSSDLTILGDLRRAKGKTLSVDLNKSGSANASLSTADRHAPKVVPWKTCLLCQHDDTTYWSGPISRRNVGYDSGIVTFSAVGWFDRLMTLILQENIAFTDDDAGAVAAVLLEKAREQDPNLPITIGTIESTQPRTITYSTGQSIGQAIQDLVEMESGFDWYIDPVERAFNIVAIRGQDRPNCKWRFTPDRANLADVDESLDGATLRNWIKPYGKFGPINPAAQDAESQQDYGVFQEAPSLADVTDNDILVAFALAELVYKAQPRITYTLTPKNNSNVSVPKLFRDFDIGDITYLDAVRDLFKIENQAVRVFGASLAINDNGSETLSNLQTNA